MRVRNFHIPRSFKVEYLNNYLLGFLSTLINGAKVRKVGRESYAKC